MDKIAILLVEPTQSLAMILNSIAFGGKVNITHVKDGKSCLDFIAHNTVDLIIMSYELHDINGKELCKNIKKSIDSSLPIILITSNEEKALQSFRKNSLFTDVFLTSQLIELQGVIERLYLKKSLEGQNKGHVLLAEDQKNLVQVYSAILESSGLAVTCASHTETAIELLSNNNFDLVIVDIVLEGVKSGFVLIEHIKREESKISHIPVIAMSASSDQARIMEAFRCGAEDFILKPFDEQIFLARALNLIKSKQRFDKIIEHESNLLEIATHDQLTGLHNRHFLIDVAHKRIAECFRQKYPLSLIVIDIDFFKNVNDKYGHSYGDAVLSSIGLLFKNHCREGDVCARFGGEEFILLLPFCPIDNALSKAEAIRSDVENQTNFKLPITISIGIATTDEKETTFNELFQKADKALYKAKENGRNQVAQYK